MFACFFLNLNDFIPFRLGEGQFNLSERTIPRSRAARSSNRVGLPICCWCRLFEQEKKKLEKSTLEWWTISIALENGWSRCVRKFSNTFVPVYHVLCYPSIWMSEERTINGGIFQPLHLCRKTILYNSCSRSTNRFQYSKQFKCFSDVLYSPGVYPRLRRLRCWHQIFVSWPYCSWGCTLRWMS